MEVQGVTPPSVQLTEKNAGPPRKISGRDKRRPDASKENEDPRVDQPNQTSEVRRRFAQRMATAAGEKIAHAASEHMPATLIELSESETAKPYITKLKSGVETIVDRIDDTVDGVVDQGNVLWLSGQEKLPTLPSKEEVRAAIAEKWGVTQAWLDERFEVYIEISEKFVDKWFPATESDAPSDDSSKPKSKQERLMAVPLKIRGGLQVYAERAQTGTQQFVGNLKSSPFSVFVIPKMNNPDGALSPYVGSIENFVKQSRLLLTQAITELRANPYVARDYFFVVYSQVSEKAQYYWSVFPSLFAVEVRKSFLYSQKKVMAFYEGLSDERKEMLVNMYHRVRGMFQGTTTDAMAEYVAQTHIYQMISRYVESIKNLEDVGEVKG